MPDGCGIAVSLLPAEISPMTVTLKSIPRPPSTMLTLACEAVWSARHDVHHLAALVVRHEILERGALLTCSRVGSAAVYHRLVRARP